MSGAKGATRATRLLDRLGVAYATHAYAFAPGEDGIGRQAATALGVPPARLLKTLVIEVDGARHALALLAVDRELDLKAAAQSLGGKRAALADLAKAEQATGYVKGGISPLATRRRLPAVLDRTALRADHVLVNAGQRGLQIELRPADLMSLTGALAAEIGRG